MSDASELFDQLEKLPLGDHAKALGYLCIMWGWLERSTAALLAVLINKDDDDATAAVVYSMDQRDTLKALLALGFIRKPNDEWYERLKTLVNNIDNDLRPERNRMVHDFWHGQSAEEVIRVTTRARVVREQARKLALKFESGKKVSVQQVYVTAFSIAAAHGKTLMLIGDYHNAQPPSPDKAD